MDHQRQLQLNRNQRATYNLEASINTKKARLQMRQSMWLKPSTIMLGKRQNLAKCAKRVHFAQVCRPANDENLHERNEE